LRFFELYFVDVFSRRYGDLRGRSRRAEVLYFFVFHALAFIAVAAFEALVYAAGVAQGGARTSPGAMLLLYGLVSVAPAVGVIVRRLHDGGRSGWWFALSCLPPLGWCVLLYFILAPGAVGENRFGPDPREPVVGAGSGGDHPV
jgi:uncharacterized membrane protein YhaH (DUF805 family)